MDLAVDLTVDDCPTCGVSAAQRRHEVPTFADSYCAKCGHDIRWVDCPTGGWWSHLEHPENGHDATPVCYRSQRGRALIPAERGCRK